MISFGARACLNSDVIRPLFEANRFKIARAGKVRARGVQGACGLVKPARLHFARTARALRDATCASEALCPNVQPRAYARLTGLRLTTCGRAGRVSP